MEPLIKVIARLGDPYLAVGGVYGVKWLVGKQREKSETKEEPKSVIK